jgi:hypothetical protein
MHLICDSDILQKDWDVVAYGGTNKTITVALILTVSTPYWYT